MTEAQWSDATKTPPIDWTVSAALENVERGGQPLAEVTSLEQAVRAWRGLAADLKADAVITIEHELLLDGVATTQFSGETLAALAERLPQSGVPS